MSGENEDIIRIDGVVRGDYASEDREPCLCCDGPHRFSVGIEVDGVDVRWRDLIHVGLYDLPENTPITLTLRTWPAPSEEKR